MKNKITELKRNILKYKLMHQSGLFLCEILRFVSFVAVILTVYVFLDYLLAFSSSKRVFLNITTISALAIFFIIRILSILKISNLKIAKTIDEISENPRQTITSAYELATENLNTAQKQNKMTNFLIAEALTKAKEFFANFSILKIFPITQLKSMLLYSIITIGISAIFLLTPYRITSVIVKRIINPHKDIPPYSEFVFKIYPENPSVIYGSDIELSVKISGKAISNSVLMHIKQDGSQSSASCFKGENNTFSLKIQKITSPLEFCFSTGRARSKWHKINVLSVPQIALVRVSVLPPPHTHLPKNEFILGRNIMKVIQNSEVTLKLTSNRPLRDGTMQIKDNTEKVKIIKSEKQNPNTILFHWKATTPARINVKFNDIAGTSCKTPLEFKQYIIEDKRPEIAITEPDLFLLATPDAKIKISGYASDDFGIKNVFLARTISGYRDRMKLLGPEFTVKNFDFSELFDLSKIGVIPGETIELYAETSDFNPSLTGINVSDIVKIKIISKTEYAEMLRTRIKVENVFEQYQAALDSFAQLKRKLEEAKKLLKDKKLTKAQKKKMIEQIKQINKKASEHLLKLSDNFPIYEMEKEQKEVFRELYTTTVKNSETLNSLNPESSNEKLIQKIQSMLSPIKAKEEKIKQIKKDTQSLESLYAIMKQISEVSKLVIKQKEIVHRLERFRLINRPVNSGMLEQLAEKEKKLTDKLNSLMNTIPKLADKLAPENGILKLDAKSLCSEIKLSLILPELNRANEAAKLKRGDKFFTHASKALEDLMALLERNKNKKNAMSQIMNGKLAGCGGNCQQTAEEMLNAILRRNKCNNQGQGKGIGQGKSKGGAGMGNPEDGYSMQSSYILNVPLAGPGRSGISKGINGDKGSGNGNSSLTPDSKETLSISSQKRIETENISLDDVPLKYKQAIKEYFRGDK